MILSRIIQMMWPMFLLLGQILYVFRLDLPGTLMICASLAILWVGHKAKNFDTKALAAFFIIYPVSFVGVVGGYGGSATWYYAVSYGLFLVYLVRFFLLPIKKQNRLVWAATLSVVVVFMYVLSYYPSADKAVWLKEFVKLPIFLLVFLYAATARNVDRDFILNAFCFSCATLALVIILQKAGMLQSVDRDIINFELHQFRKAYTGLMADRTQAAVSLAVAAVYVVVSLPTSKYPKLLWLMIALLCVFASAMTSSRAGIVVFILAMGVYVLKGNVTLGKRVLWALAGIALFIVSYQILVSQRQWVGDSLISVYYRAPLTQQYLEYFFIEEPLALFLGVGAGSENHTAMGFYFTPHNFFLEMLATGGLLGLVIAGLFCNGLWQVRKDPLLFYPLIAFLIGTMVMPNVLNSRVFMMLLLIMSLEPISMILIKRR